MAWSILVVMVLLVAILMLAKSIPPGYSPEWRKDDGDQAEEDGAIDTYLESTD